MKRWFSQQDHRIRLLWGRHGVRRAADRGDIAVVVDVLTFSTTAAVAASRGVVLYPFGPGEPPGPMAKRLGAELAVPREQVPPGRFSLSPLTFLDAPDELKLLLPSPNGAACVSCGGSLPHVVVAALVNASEAAGRVARLLSETELGVTVVACGERWREPCEDGELRFALEDYLGAGAVLARLEGDKSAEARAAEAAWHGAGADIEAVLLDCGSGRELQGRGYQADVRLAARLDAFPAVPVLAGACLMAASR